MAREAELAPDALDVHGAACVYACRERSMRPFDRVIWKGVMIADLATYKIAGPDAGETPRLAEDGRSENHLPAEA